MRALVLVFVALLVAPAGEARPQLPPPQVISTWVELVDGGVAEARAVVERGGCPIVVVDGAARRMAIRARPGLAFAQTVCTLKLPKDARSAAIDGRPLALPRPVNRIVVFGDTGCRLKGADIQDCNNPDLWPFAIVTRMAAAEKPDLVIHVGDYYYRETPCPAMYSGCAGSPYGDAWPSWQAEFFGPAKPLLDAAPWVFARGNHESCDRGWRGWFRMLDAGPRGSTPSCPGESAAFAVPIGGVTLHVLDSAGADDRGAPPAALAVVNRQLATLGGEGANGAWIVTHRPFWDQAVVGIFPLSGLRAELNKTEQVAARRADMSSVAMILSGHVHHFAAIDFGGRRPVQLVVGTGGDNGEIAEQQRPKAERIQMDGLSAEDFSFRQFGYFVMDRTPTGWTGMFKNKDGQVVARCTVSGRRLRCR
jgi:hypothetical protein